MNHTHTFDSDVFLITETSITTAVLGCICGAIAAVGEGFPSLIWEPEEVAA